MKMVSNKGKSRDYIAALKASPTIRELKFMLYRVRQNPLSLIGLGIILFFVFVGLFAPLLAPPKPGFDPFMIPRRSYSPIPQPPSMAYPFGLSPDGYDIYYGCVWGTITAFRVGVTVVAFALVIGVIIGILAGYYGGIVDEILMRFTDVIIVFPGLILALAFSIALPSTLGITAVPVMIAISIIAVLITLMQVLREGLSRKGTLTLSVTIVLVAITIFLYVGAIPNVKLISLELSKLDKVLLALTLVGWPGYARVIRGEVLRVKTEDYVEAAKAAGCSDFRILTRHIIPNAIYPILILASLDIGSIVLTAAALSFLGVGAEPGFADWGQLVEKSQQFLGTGELLVKYWFIWIIPGAFIFIFSLGWNLLGDAIRDIMDPTLRRR
jgi:peptide/nickel transport system permease protein